MGRLGGVGYIEEFNGQAEDYLDHVEKSIEHKMRIMQELREEVNKLRRRKREVD